MWQSFTICYISWINIACIIWGWNNYQCTFDRFIDKCIYCISGPYEKNLYLLMSSPSSDNPPGNFHSLNCKMEGERQNDRRKIPDVNKSSLKGTSTDTNGIECHIIKSLPSGSCLWWLTHFQTFHQQHNLPGKKDTSEIINEIIELQLLLFIICAKQTSINFSAYPQRPPGEWQSVVADKESPLSICTGQHAHSQHDDTESHI